MRTVLTRTSRRRGQFVRGGDEHADDSIDEDEQEMGTSRSRGQFVRNYEQRGRDELRVIASRFSSATDINLPRVKTTT